MSANGPIQAAPQNHEDMIHIVGMYKCGTSWLLHMLAAHPHVVGWREFDAIRAAYAPHRRILELPIAGLDYLRPRPQNNAWMRRREHSSLRPAQDVFREMFLARGWIPIMGSDKQRQADEFDTEDLDALLEQLLALGDYRLRPSTAPLIDPTRHTDKLGVQSFRRNDLLTLMQAVRDCSHTEKIPTLFFEALRSQATTGSRVATKAADQLMQLAALKHASPGSQTIAIVRDGRDAAISAQHFERLMRKQEAPWQTQNASYLRRLLGWSMRAAKLAEHAARGELTVLRYEDLHTDFNQLCRALFIKLGLDVTPEIIECVKDATDFSTVTEGRTPGESADHEIRKGSFGEWKDALSSSQAALAWKLAGDSLSAFGYTRRGAIEASPLVLSC
ncbi:sulfotransferase [Congregibacter variabilis]|uniref:Sulfotransferase n=1 Tax=Congregibacter variabilis TaxID=3081200 RepID=A0ABZ0I9C9_9GAMM|nr:sulfotransferase [Congregibacter sp. IMCC43200]